MSAIADACDIASTTPVADSFACAWRAHLRRQERHMDSGEMERLQGQIAEAEARIGVGT